MRRHPGVELPSAVTRPVSTSIALDFDVRAPDRIYISADQRLAAVLISAGSALQVGKPPPLFANAEMNSFVPSKSGDRFLINLPVSGEQAVTPPIIVVTDWTATIAR